MNKKVLRKIGAFVENDHFVYSTGNHGSVYINKNKLNPHPIITEKIHNLLAKKIVSYNLNIDVVIGPSTGGIVLSQEIAKHLTRKNKKEILALFADKSGKGGFVIKRDYDTLIKGKSILLVEDGILTSKSVKKVIRVVNRAKGNIVGLGVLFNKGGVTAKDLNIPILISLFNVNYKDTTWPADKCPLCKAYIPINLYLGQGKNYI
jgi:orotate phosphoribosyltransferase